MDQFARISGLSHLRFIDEILVFTDGTKNLLYGVLRVLDQFARISGLHINGSKSAVYSTGTNRMTTNQEDENKGMSVGTPPFRNLVMH